MRAADDRCAFLICYAAHAAVVGRAGRKAHAGRALAGVVINYNVGWRINSRKLGVVDMNSLSLRAELAVRVGKCPTDYGIALAKGSNLIRYANDLPVTSVGGGRCGRQRS